MKTPIRKFVALAGTIALLVSPVTPLLAAQAEGGFEAFDPGAILHSPAPQAGEELLAYDMSRIISTQTRMIRYEATEYQRKVAEQRARSFMAAHRRSVAAAQKSTASTKSAAKKTPKSKPSEPEVVETPKKKKKSTEIADNRKTPEAPEKPHKKAPAEPEPAPKSKTAEKVEELPRYIAVDTVKDKRASPKAKKVVMIWDTHSEKLVGNNIYDVENPPRVGEKRVFETYSAEYIGAGL